MTEWESKALLGEVPRPRECLTRTAAEAGAFARELGVGVVAKASGPAHKTESGGVRIGLDALSLEACWDELAALGDGSVLVAEQVRADLELMAGGLRDPAFGPVVSIGFGGVAAEVLRDVAFLLAPPEPGELDRALDGLRGAALLNGFRGTTPVDRAALASIVAAISRLLVEDGSVLEVDVNPIIVSGGVPYVADALVVRA